MLGIWARALLCESVISWSPDVVALEAAYRVGGRRPDIVDCLKACIGDGEGSLVNSTKTKQRTTGRRRCERGIKKKVRTGKKGREKRSRRMELGVEKGGGNYRILCLVHPGRNACWPKHQFQQEIRSKERGSRRRRRKGSWRRCDGRVGKV